MTEKLASVEDTICHNHAYRCVGSKAEIIIKDVRVLHNNMVKCPLSSTNVCI